MEDNGPSIEIIEFTRPDNAQKCLYVSNIKYNTGDNTKLQDKFSEDLAQQVQSVKDSAEVLNRYEVQKLLENQFGKFGLLYEVNVVETPTADTDTGANHLNLCAFVRYYSSQDAAVAKTQLTGRIFINGALAKIRFSTRHCKDEPPILYSSKCYELANHFLGFNGWTIQILSMTDEGAMSDNPTSVGYRCVVKLNLPKHDLCSTGIAIAQQTFSSSDPASKGAAICRAKKNAYQEATRNAFKKVLIIRLPDKRVYVEINTTVEEALHYDEDLNKENLLKVTEIEEPQDSSSENDDSDIEDDQLNKMILQELVEDNF